MHFLVCILTPWSRVLPEKLTVSQLVKKYPSPHFMDTEGPLPCPQQPVTCPYSEPNESSPRYPIVLKTHFNITLPSTTRSSYLNICRELLDDKLFSLEVKRTGRDQNIHLHVLLSLGMNGATQTTVPLLSSSELFHQQ
jgi:hypothetical protein